MCGDPNSVFELRPADQKDKEPKKTRPEAGHTPETCLKTGEPCAKVGMDPNTPLGATEGVVSNPPVRNVHPPIRQARTRAVKVYVLTPLIHDQKVTPWCTMVQPSPSI